MTATLRAVVQKTWSFGPRVYWTGRDSKEQLHRFVWTAATQAPAAGEVWEITGTSEIHAEYGAQWIVSSARWVEPRGKLLIEFLARNEAFSGLGIGIARASALYAQFGDGLFDILSSGDEEKLCQVEKLPASSIKPLIAAWRSAQTQSRVVRWLARYDVPYTLAAKLLDFYGADSEAKLEDNPYRLLAFTSFRHCDQIGKVLGLDELDPRRCVAVIQNCLYQELASGHTATPRDILIARAGAYFAAARVDASRQAITQAIERKAVLESAVGVSTSGVRALEFDLKERISALLRRAKSASDGVDPNSAIRRFEAESGFGLNDSQKRAVLMALEEPLSILCGYAGSGKTTVLRTLCSALPWSTFQMALTGQAAKRMIEATKHPATTIEYFLRHIAKSLSPLSAPLVIIDEASMLDLPLTIRILRSLPPTARLLLVGDPAQLPPIGFGLVFHRMVESSAVPRTELTIINRQAENSGIPAASRAIRNGSMPELREYQGLRSGVFFLECSRRDIIQRLVDVKADQPDAQVLAIKNRGGAGILDINEVFHRIHGAGKRHIATLPFCVGEPVIFKKNVGELNLVNGSLGVVQEITESVDSGPMAVCDFSGEIKEISGENIENLRHSYGITVHSAQGSQFGRVIVVVEKSRLLDRTLIYTALTRGIAQVTFVGDATAFQRGVAAEPAAAKRRTWFAI